MKNINTASVCTPVFAVSLAFAAGAARADAAYSYENDNKTYVVTVEAGETATLADGDAPTGVLKENNVTNFVKRGDGTLKVSANLSSFAGDLYVEDGVYSSSPTADNAANTTAGATGTEYKIFVLPGATFDFDTTVTGHFLEREWHITGRGYDDPEKGELGALHSTASGQALSAVAGTVILEGETMIRYGGGSNIALVGCPMDMQRNTLVLKSDAETLGPIVTCNNKGKDFKTHGGNVVVEGCVNISDDLGWLDSGTPGGCSLTVSANSTLLLNSMSDDDVRSTANHTLVLKEGAKIVLVGRYDKTFRGGVVFEDPVRNVITSSAGDGEWYRINFVCDVKGSGFVADGNALVEIRKYDGESYAFENTSTNGMVVANGAHLDLRSTEKELLNLSQDGGDITVSNGTVCCDNQFYSFARWDGALRFYGDNNTWTGYPFYDFDDPWDIAASGRRNSFKFKNLYFCGNPSIAFSTNVIVNSLNGVGAVSNVVRVTADSRVYTSKDANRCRAFKVLGTWSFDVADVLAGGSLATDGRLDFYSGATIRMNGTGKPTDGDLSRVVAYAEGGIYGLDSAVLEVDEYSRWRLSAGSDGKTLIATYLPNGMAIIVR